MIAFTSRLPVLSAASSGTETPVSVWTWLPIAKISSPAPVKGNEMFGSLMKSSPELEFCPGKPRPHHCAGAGTFSRGAGTCSAI